MEVGIAPASSCSRSRARQARCRRPFFVVAAESPSILYMSPLFRTGTPRRRPRPDRTLVRDAATAGARAAHLVAVEEVEPVVAALLDGDDVTAGEALATAYALRGGLALLYSERIARGRYPYFVHSSSFRSVGRVPGCGEHLRGHLLCQRPHCLMCVLKSQYTSATLFAWK